MDAESKLLRIKSKIVFNEANNSAEKSRARIKYVLNERLELKESFTYFRLLIIGTTLTAVFCLYLIPHNNLGNNPSVVVHSNEFAELEDESIGNELKYASSDLSEDLSSILTLKNISNEEYEVDDDNTTVDNELESGYDELLYGV